MRPIRAAMRIGPGQEGRELLGGPWVDLRRPSCLRRRRLCAVGWASRDRVCNSASAKAALMMCGHGARRTRQGPGAAVARPRYRGPAFAVIIGGPLASFAAFGLVEDCSQTSCGTTYVIAHSGASA
jgi:hypothetical protein